MKVEIWSDVMCAFCYIGKRKFEKALEQFPHKETIEIVWKSFQLMPNLKTNPDRNLDQFLADEKGMSIEQAKSMNSQVTEIAKQIGLNYNFEKTIPANTFNAHRFTHFAKANDKQDEAEEKLFHAYFIEGKNIDDYATLIQLGEEIGLDTSALTTALENGSYTDEVRADIYEAQQVGVRGVPFFLFNKKQAVSGAQEPQTFLQTLETSYAEWQKDNPKMKKEIIEEAQICTPDGDCK